ncbi:MAG: prolipoprotein diacylglyceryl transferase, partial [Sphingomonadales bacterium]|nr:prolipoprotein diacylglyceryl transferase [Sphingomonadales bacterium]
MDVSPFVVASRDVLQWSELGLSPIALDLGFFQLRWYSLAYIAGILLGWWYLLKLIAKPGSPMARRHADDLVFYATLGVLLGGRLGYVFFYKPLEYLENPVDIIRVWDGGMSFHGGVIGVSLAILLMARKHRLDWLRIHDYVACTVPIGLFFG